MNLQCSTVYAKKTEHFQKERFDIRTIYYIREWNITVFLLMWMIYIENNFFKTLPEI